MLSVLALMSGGIDSSAMASFYLDRGTSVRGLFIDFGQAAAAQERQHVARVCQSLNIDLEIVSASLGNGYLSGEIVGRNMFLLSTALMTKVEENAIAIGVHSGTPYFDCSTSFLNSMQHLISEHFDGKVQLLAPFAEWTKADVFSYFLKQGLSLDLTYSCEDGGTEICGKCLSCIDKAALNALCS